MPNQTHNTNLPIGPQSHVRLTIDGHTLQVPAGTIVAAAIAMAGCSICRSSVSGGGRAPLCGMGICYECRVTIDDQSQRLSCQTICEEGMCVTTQCNTAPTTFL